MTYCLLLFSGFMHNSLLTTPFTILSSFSVYLLNTYYISGPQPDAADTTVNSVSPGICFLGQTINNSKLKENEQNDLVKKNWGVPDLMGAKWELTAEKEPAVWLRGGSVFDQKLNTWILRPFLPFFTVSINFSGLQQICKTKTHAHVWMSPVVGGY